MMKTQRFGWRRLTRPIRHLLLSLTLSLLSSIARRLPLKLCQRGGIAFGLMLRAILPHQRALISRQLFHTQNALNLNTNEISEINRLHWADLGRRVGEWLAGKKALSLFWISPTAKQKLHQAYLNAQSERGLVVCTAHYGHWELLASWLSHQGYDFLAVASSLPQGPYGKWIDT